MFAEEDFRLSGYSDEVLNRLWNVHSSNADLLSKFFTGYLNCKTSVKALPVESLTHREFSLSLFELSPVAAVLAEPDAPILIGIDNPLAFAILRMLTGGEVHDSETDSYEPTVYRELTEIEKAVLKVILEALAASLKKSWSGISRLLLKAVERPADAVKGLSGERGVLLSSEVRMGGIESLIHLYLPEGSEGILLNVPGLIESRHGDAPGPKLTGRRDIRYQMIYDFPLTWIRIDREHEIRLNLDAHAEFTIGKYLAARCTSRLIPDSEDARHPVSLSGSGSLNEEAVSEEGADLAGYLHHICLPLIARFYGETRELDDSGVAGPEGIDPQQIGSFAGAKGELLFGGHRVGSVRLEENERTVTGMCSDMVKTVEDIVHAPEHITLTSLAFSLKDEHPQMMALLFSLMEERQCATVLSFLPWMRSDGVRFNLVKRIARTSGVKPEIISTCVAGLGDRHFFPGRERVNPGGIPYAAGLLSYTDLYARRSYLETLDREIPEIARKVRAEMFRRGWLLFEHLLQFPDRIIRNVLHGIPESNIDDLDQLDCALAIARLDTGIQNKILQNLPEKAAAYVRDHLEFENMSFDEQAWVQQKIVERVLKLESEGVITVVGK